MGPPPGLARSRTISAVKQFERRASRNPWFAPVKAGNFLLNVGHAKMPGAKEIFSPMD
jgi:hypothetical protein